MDNVHGQICEYVCTKEAIAFIILQILQRIWKKCLRTAIYLKTKLHGKISE